jgi:hypothetical protein
MFPKPVSSGKNAVKVPQVFTGKLGSFGKNVLQPFSTLPAVGGAGSHGMPVRPLPVRFYSRADDTPAKKTPQTHRVNGVTGAHKLLIAFKTPRQRG